MAKKATRAAAFPIERLPIKQSTSRYPFASLEPPKKKRGAEPVYDTFFVPDPKKVSTLRSQASRMGASLGRTFSVRVGTGTNDSGQEVPGVRIYRIK